MDAREIEQMLRRVVREELAALLGREIPPAPVARVEIPRGPAENPFLLSEPELKQAERLLSEEEGKILRQRVYAARLEAAGNAASAKRMRTKADRMEKELEAKRARGH